MSFIPPTRPSDQIKWATVAARLINLERKIAEIEVLPIIKLFKDGVREDNGENKE